MNETRNETRRYVIKRNGEEVPFDISKPVACILKANATVSPERQLSQAQVDYIAEQIEKTVNQYTRATDVETIQDLIIKEIVELRANEVALSYTKYRTEKAEKRKGNTTDAKILALVDGDNEEDKQENANKDTSINSTKRDYIAGHVSKDLTRRKLLHDVKHLSEKGKEIIKEGDGEKILKAHDEGVLHFHDMDYYIQHMSNCCLVNLEDMLQNGTVISGTMIEKPKSFYTAANITTQIIAQVASSQYGGQSISLAHLAPFVDISRQKIRKHVIEEMSQVAENLSEESINKIVEKRLEKEVASGIQTIQYQLITLMTTNGQAPFVTIFLNINEAKEGQEREDLVMLIKEVFKQRIKGVKNANGTWVAPAFPKLIYALDENNAEEGSKYFEVTKLAAECTAKRMVPDYISAKIMREQKNGDVYPAMGCRSFLTPDDGAANAENIAKAQNYIEGEHKYYGRFNQGVVTINLVDVACSSNGDEDFFWSLLDQRLELCHKALRFRHERLLGTKSDVAPILWQYGALARLAPGETIDKLLYNNYSTISLGYAGLYEMTVRMTGETHTSEAGKEFALRVMQKLNDKCNEWKADENISYSLYGTPMESTTYKFAKALQDRFGIIPDVTDHNYITNSYHVNVREELTAFEKLEVEAEFQKLSPGGAISYVEVPNMNNNIPAIVSIIQAIYDDIMYAELNTKADYCECCGYDGEMVLVDDGYGKLVWECPNCGNRDTKKMVVVRRVCGYLGEAQRGMNQGRLGDIHDRVLHVSILKDEAEKVKDEVEKVLV